MTFKFIFAYLHVLLSQALQVTIILKIVLITCLAFIFSGLHLFDLFELRLIYVTLNYLYIYIRYRTNVARGSDSVVHSKIHERYIY